MVYYWKKYFDWRKELRLKLRVDSYRPVPLCYPFKEPFPVRLRNAFNNEDLWRSSKCGTAYALYVVLLTDIIIDTHYRLHSSIYKMYTDLFKTYQKKKVNNNNEQKTLLNYRLHGMELELECCRHGHGWNMVVELD